MEVLVTVILRNSYSVYTAKIYPKNKVNYTVKMIYHYLDHVERKVPKYENHKLRERKVKTLTRN